MSPNTRRTSCSAASPRFRFASKGEGNLPPSNSPHRASLHSGDAAIHGGRLRRRVWPAVKRPLAHADPWCMRRVLGMVGLLDIPAANTAGDVVGFDVQGRTLFRAHDDASRFHGIFGTPTVADLDRDGRREVIVGSWDQHVYAWHVDDRSPVPGFPTFVGDTIWSSPAVADLDGDGYPEIIIGGDCDGVAGQRCYPQRGGYVWVFRH